VHPSGGRLERAARLLTVLLVLGLPAALLASRLADSGPATRTIELVARQPAAGGWSRERIVVNRGERVRLRIRAEDVVHGFAIGRLGVDVGAIEPGKVATVEFFAREAGEFTFYCTVWCERDHPRMRGILEVRAPGQAPAPARSSPPDVALRELDVPRGARAVPEAPPSAARGRQLFARARGTCHGGDGQGTSRAPAIGRRDRLEDVSPVQLFERVAHERPKESLSRQDRWDVVAHLWSRATTPERLELGRRLYATNCAPCHGARGGGDGPAGPLQPKTPASFANARAMLAGTSALYTAKVRRGGMGTGMPYWGSIFTEEELAAVVDVLWTFSIGASDGAGARPPS
jgi:cytochrome c oxidase subunit 2